MAENDQDRDRVFDHQYDGIEEYDNPMPKWWVYLFVASIAFAFPYVLHYHYGKGLSPDESWQAEQEAYANMLLATYGDLQPDVPTLVTYMDEATAMTGMAGLFKGKCAQCHLADGSGSVGPNLTDDVWKNVKEITDIPGIIRSGIDGKGMPAWGDRLTETQIVLLASYVAQLGRNPLPGKEPEGRSIEPWPSGPFDSGSETAEALPEEDGGPDPTGIEVTE